MAATTTESVSPAEAAPGLDRIQALIEKIEAVPDAASRALMQECLHSLLELYGDGLERIMDHAGDELRQAFAQDEIVRALLLVHGLHPVPVEERLAGALESVRPYMGKPRRRHRARRGGKWRRHLALAGALQDLSVFQRDDGAGRARRHRGSVS